MKLMRDLFAIAKFLYFTNIIQCTSCSRVSGYF